MLVGNGYECMGGPWDGRRLQLAPGTNAVTVALHDSPPAHVLSGPASPIGPWPRIGEYRVERHAQHGYVLCWHPPT